MDRATLARVFMYGKIVDIGCGDALYLWGGNPPKNVTCVDIDQFKHTHVIAEASKLPFKDKTFDTALLLEILEHVDDVEKVLKEALRVSNIAIVSYPNETYDECKTRRPDINEFIDRLYNLVKPYREGDLGFKAHYHWKSRERIDQDINTIRKLCNKEYKLDYGLYDGWGFICGGIEI